MEIKTGYKQTEIGIIPNDWDVTEIPNLASHSGFVTPNHSPMLKMLAVKPITQLSDNKSKTVAFMSIPKVMVIPVTNATIATAGMVKPIQASAEPKAKFKLVCKRFLLAAL